MERVKFSVTRKDFDITWFSGTGGGGQHRNKHQNCCRLKHKDTGVIKTGQSHRDRPSNQKEALTSMANDVRFRSYCDLKLSEIETGESIEDWVNKEIEDNVKTEVIRDGKWEEE